MLNLSRLRLSRKISGRLFKSGFRVGSLKSPQSQRPNPTQRPPQRSSPPANCKRPTLIFNVPHLNLWRPTPLKIMQPCQLLISESLIISVYIARLILSLSRQIYAYVRISSLLISRKKGYLGRFNSSTGFPKKDDSLINIFSLYFL